MHQRAGQYIVAEPFRMLIQDHHHLLARKGDLSFTVTESSFRFMQQKPRTFMYIEEIGIARRHISL
ncbi:hypothetical protein D3C81_2097910 [compost metagenome]